MIDIAPRKPGQNKVPIIKLVMCCQPDCVRVNRSLKAHRYVLPNPAGFNSPWRGIGTVFRGGLSPPDENSMKSTFDGTVSDSWS